MKSYLLLLFCVTFWGSNFVFGSILIKEFQPMHLSTVRLTTTAIVLFAYGAYAKRITKPGIRDIAYLVPLGIIGTLLNQAAFFSGLQTTDATTSSLILSLAPICTALLARLFLKEPFTLRMGMGSILALLGVFLVIGRSSGLHVGPGIAFLFVAMLTFAVSVILMRKLTERLDAFTATVYSTFFGCILMYPVASVKEPGAVMSGHVWAWLLLFGSAIVSQGVCSLIWNGQLRNVGAAKASVFLNLQPFVAMTTGYLLLGTPVTLIQVGGSVLIIGGVVLATWQGLSVVKREQEPAHAPLPETADSKTSIGA